jgi:hypothetical protein
MARVTATRTDEISRRHGRPPESRGRAPLRSAAAGHFCVRAGSALPGPGVPADTGANHSDDAPGAKSAMPRFFPLYRTLLQLPAKSSPNYHRN